MWLAELARYLRTRPVDVIRIAKKTGHLRRVPGSHEHHWVSDRGAAIIITIIRRQQGEAWETGKLFPSRYG